MKGKYKAVLETDFFLTKRLSILKDVFLTLIHSSQSLEVIEKQNQVSSSLNRFREASETPLDDEIRGQEGGQEGNQEGRRRNRRFSEVSATPDINCLYIAIKEIDDIIEALMFYQGLLIVVITLLSLLFAVVYIHLTISIDPSMISRSISLSILMKVLFIIYSPEVLVVKV